ncbi:MAG: LysR family transcriptional regulator [Azoarcus sp.]
MDIDLLRTFMEVHRLRHFGAAAESLHVTQAAVSARIKQLEALLGTRLFDRSRRDVRVTPEGHRFLHSADLIISEWRRARHIVGMDGVETPQLSIAGSQRLWDIFLQEGWLHALRRARPDIALSVETGAPEILISRLFEGLLDVVVMLEPPRIELMTETRLTQIDLFLVSTSPGQTASEALGDGYVMIDWGQAFEVEHRERFPEAPAPMTTVSNSGMALDYLKAIGGAAFLPGRVIQPEIDAGNLFTVEGVAPISRGVYGIYLNRNPKRPVILEALGILNAGKRISIEGTGAVNDRLDAQAQGHKPSSRIE